jgi:hypothetical protein
MLSPRRFAFVFLFLLFAAPIAAERFEMPRKYTESAAPVLPQSDAKTPDVGGGVPQLSSDDCIENSPDFKKAARNAWSITTRAGIAEHRPVEAGFTVDSEGKPSEVSQNDEPAKGAAGSLKQNFDSGTKEAFHTHPNFGNAGQEPSSGDIDVAKKTKRQIMVSSSKGLFEVDAQGNVSKVFNGTGWMADKKPAHVQAAAQDADRPGGEAHPVRYEKTSTETLGRHVTSAPTPMYEPGTRDPDDVKARAKLFTRGSQKA